MKYRTHLPQLDGGLFLTDGGLETTLVFHEGGGERRLAGAWRARDAEDPPPAVRGERAGALDQVRRRRVELPGRGHRGRRYGGGMRDGSPAS